MSRDRHKRISINAPRYKRMGHGVRPDPKPEDSDCSLSSSSQSSGESTRTKVNFSSRGLAGFRLVRIPIAIIFIFSLFIFFAWSLVEVLLELFNISFPKPIVHQVIFLGILLLLSIIYILGAIKVINQGYEAIVERLGRFTKILKPGIHLVNPILDIVLVDSLREQGLDTSLQPIFTKDNELIKVSSFVLWKILDVSIASYAIENLESYLLALVRTSTSNEIAQMDLREALSLRSKINEKVLNVLEEATLAWGIKIIRVEIQEMRLSQSLLTAFEAERSAEILNRAGILGAEGKKHVAIQEAEIRHLVAIQDTNTEIEISKLRIEAYKAGILLSKQQEEELREEVEKRIEEEKEHNIFYFNPTLNLSQQTDLETHTENKLMDKSRDESRKVQVGRDLNQNNSLINLGEIGGAVTNAINCLPTDSVSEQNNLKELLTQLKTAIEEENELLVEDKADLLEQVKILAEAKTTPEPEKREGLIRKAKKIFDATIKSLPDTAKLAEACSKLLPLILQALSLSV